MLYHININAYNINVHSSKDDPKWFCEIITFRKNENKIKTNFIIKIVSIISKRKTCRPMFVSSNSLTLTRKNRILINNNLYCTLNICFTVIISVLKSCTGICPYWKRASQRTVSKVPIMSSLCSLNKEVKWDKTVAFKCLNHRENYCKISPFSLYLPLSYCYHFIC